MQHQLVQHENSGTSNSAMLWYNIEIVQHQIVQHENYGISNNAMFWYNIDSAA